MAQQLTRAGHSRNLSARSIPDTCRGRMICWFRGRGTVIRSADIKKRLPFFPVLLRSTSLALCGIRDGVQAGLGDLFTTLVAPAVAAVIDPLDRCFNLIESVFVASEQSNRQFLIGIVTPKLFHVSRNAFLLSLLMRFCFILQKASEWTGRESDRPPTPPMRQDPARRRAWPP